MKIFEILTEDYGIINDPNVNRFESPKKLRELMGKIRGVAGQIQDSGEAEGYNGNFANEVRSYAYDAGEYIKTRVQYSDDPDRAKQQRNNVKYALEQLSDIWKMAGTLDTKSGSNKNKMFANQVRNAYWPAMEILDAYDFVQTEGYGMRKGTAMSRSYDSDNTNINRRINAQNANTARETNIAAKRDQRKIDRNARVGATGIPMRAIQPSADV